MNAEQIQGDLENALSALTQAHHYLVAADRYLDVPADLDYAVAGILNEIPTNEVQDAALAIRELLDARAEAKRAEKSGTDDQARSDQTAG